jgi:hypothetical protein
MNPESRNEIVKDVVIDFGLHMRNRDKHFSPQDLLKYAGQEVAFSADGTRIVIHGEHGEDWETLWNRLIDQGINPCGVVWSYIPRLDEEP